MEEHEVVTKGNVTKVKAKTGYSPGVETLCKVVDNGNGYTVKFPSHSSVYADIYMSIDYAESEYLRLILNFIEMERVGG